MIHPKTSPFLHRAIVSTPVGEMMLLASPKALCACEFPFPERQELLRSRLAQWYGAPEVVDGESPILGRAREWLTLYFRGEPESSLPQLSLDARGTPFELAVWKRMQQIPVGAVATYGAIARKLEKPWAARAVGNASRRNPLALIVPCHRVVGVKGALTGYGGGLKQKAWLIKHEAQMRTLVAAIRTV